MLEQSGNSITFKAFFVAAKIGKTALTVTVDVYYPGSTTPDVTAASATEQGGGLYKYVLASGSVTTEGEYTAIFKTSDTTVDQQHIPSQWTVGRAGVEHLDADISDVPADVVIAVNDGDTSAIAQDAAAAYARATDNATAIAAVKAKTDLLPSDPADASDVAASFTTVNDTLSTIAGYVDTEVAAIKAKTDLIPASPAAVGSAMTLTAGERTSVATAILDTDLDSHTTAGTVGRALQIARAQGKGKWVIDSDANTLTLYDVDNVTSIAVFDLGPAGGPYKTRTATAE